MYHKQSKKLKKKQAQVPRLPLLLQVQMMMTTMIGLSVGNATAVGNVHVVMCQENLLRHQDNHVIVAMAQENVMFVMVKVGGEVD